MFQDGLSMEELAAQEAIELPERELLQRLSLRRNNWALVVAFNVTVVPVNVVDGAESVDVSSTATQAVTVSQPQE